MPLSYKIYPNSIIHPATIEFDGYHRGGVRDESGSLAAYSCFSGFMELLPDDDGSGAEYVDEDVIFIGHLMQCYGHVITDCLKHAWFVQSAAYEQYKDRRMVYIACPDKGVHVVPFQKEIFRLAGVNLDDCSLILKPTRFRSVLVPDASFYDTRRHEHPTQSCDAAPFCTPEFMGTISHMISEALKLHKPGADKKIYFSRRQRHVRGNMTAKAERDGERMISRYAEAAGFKSVLPQEHTVAEQIAMLQGCDTFLVTDGSAAHNALFLRDGAELVVLRKVPHENMYTTAIVAARKGISARIIDCHLSLLYDRKVPTAGPFFVYVNKALSEYFGAERPMFPFKSFRRYLSNARRFGTDDLARRFCVSPDYAAILADEVSYAMENLRVKWEKLLPRWLPMRARVVKYLVKKGVERLF